MNFITFDITKLTDFCLFNTLYCAISGIISVENEAKNIDGKFKSGNAIPLITPNIDREVAVDEPYDFNALGIKISYIDLKNVCTYALPAIGRATEINSVNIVFFDVLILIAGEFFFSNMYIR